MSVTTQSAHVLQTLDVNELAGIFHLSPSTVRSTLVKSPASLPPRLILKGQKKLLWLRSDVEAWLLAAVRQHGTNPEFKVNTAGMSAHSSGKKRGRPTKAEQLLRRTLQSDAGVESQLRR